MRMTQRRVLAPDERTYPYLGEFPNGSVVLWLDEGDGIVLIGNNGTPLGTRWTRGEHDCINMQGSIELRN